MSREFLSNKWQHKLLLINLKSSKKEKKKNINLHVDMMFMDFVKIFTWKKIFFFHFQSLRMEFIVDEWPKCIKKATKIPKHAWTGHKYDDEPQMME